MIPRLLEKNVKEDLFESNKVVVIYGARQVGKTTLVRQVLNNFKGKVLEINADRTPYQEAFSSRDFAKLKGLVSGYDLIFLDEAQRIPDIGINLKILHDSMPGLKIVVTGSSSLDLANRVKEPLTGRTWTHQLYPISVEEWKQYSGINDFQLGLQVEEWLRFGLYPEVVLTENHKQKIRRLNELTTSYLYKDILTLGGIKFPEKLHQLLKLLAFQIGNLISIHELSNTLQMHREAVLNYLQLLEKNFVIFRLGGFSRNLRKEVVRMDKVFFYDLGIRNMLTGNFNSLVERRDGGHLWENFLLAERMKKKAYEPFYANTYFWRTYSGAELNYVEERDGRLFGFEFKWGNKKAKAPKTWLDTYANASYQLVNRDNFLEFVT